MTEWNELFKDKEFQFEEPEPLFVEFFDKYGKGKVLDIGCGRGRNTFYAGSKNTDVFGIDSAPDVVKFVNKKITDNQIKNIHIKEADFHSLPFEDATFDCVFSINVMNHGYLKELKNAFKESFRVLKSGGYCYFHGGNVEFLKQIKKEDSKEVEPNTYVNIGVPDGDMPHHFFTKEELIDIFDGFEIVKFENVKIYSPWMKKEVEHIDFIAKKN